MSSWNAISQGVYMAGYTETIRKILSDEFAEASEEEKSKAVDDVKQVCSVAAAAVAFQPLPLIDMPLISPIQIAMVQAIGKVHGYKLDTRSVIEVLSTFGGSILAQSAIITAAKLVPFAGWVLSISMAYALTYAVGEVADYYFRSGRGASSKELKALFKKVYAKKKAEKESEHRDNSSLKEKLEQLKEAYAAGLLTEEEFEKKKGDVLSSF